MKTEAWSCDWCGEALPGAPALQACIREPASGNFLLPMDGCQKCLDKFITMLDPDVSQRKELGAKMGRTLQFRAFPGRMLCGCKSAVTCPHGGG